MQIRPIGTLLSNLSGSILGILGALGFLMANFEKLHIKYRKNYDSIISRRKLRTNREQILSKNFDSKEIQNSIGNSTEMNFTFDWFRHRLSSKVHDYSPDRMNHTRLEDGDLAI